MSVKPEWLLGDTKLMFSIIQCKLNVLISILIFSFNDEDTQLLDNSLFKGMQSQCKY